MIIRGGTTSVHIISFFDEQATPVQPLTGTYSVKDLATGDYIIPSTPFTPSATTHTLTISSTDNQIHTTGNVIERRELTVGFTYGSNKIGGSNSVYTLNDAPVTVDDVMENLMGWVKDTDVADPVEDDYDVTVDLVEKYIVKSIIRASNYMNLANPNQIPVNDTVMEAISIWAAGLLYKWRYTVDSPDLELQAYGNELIEDARTILKEYLSGQKESIGIGCTVDETIGTWDEDDGYYGTHYTR